ncbi:hypothetical protein EYC58_03220 [Candidatus Saccharibacteria bacterium]|nr:MAG: hypothetical protein EYC58_03220 [Candidatus Saccharibacteria bacterium]
MSTKRFQFDPAAAMTAATAAAEAELNAQLDEVDADVRRLSGELINLASEVFEGLQADDDQPVKVQLTNARAARDKLQAMLDGAKGASSATLSPDEQELLDLFRRDKIKFVTGELDDPANPGQTMSGKLVIDTRRARRRSSNPTPAQGSGPAPAAPTPAAPPDPSPAAQAQSTPAQPNDPTPQNPPAPVDPADPAQSNTGQPSDPPAQAGSGTTPAPTAQFEPGIIDKAKAGLAGLFRREPTS